MNERVFITGDSNGISDKAYHTGGDCEHTIPVIKAGGHFARVRLRATKGMGRDMECADFRGREE
jgi:hypothetical protein